MSDPPDDHRAEAYVLLSTGDRPPLPSRALPRIHSAFLPSRGWQTCTFALDERSVQDAELRLEVVSWAPGRGETPLGPIFVSVDQVRRGGRMELAGPLGVAIEVEWLPPVTRGEADRLTGSGVHLATSTWAEEDFDLARKRIWHPGLAPTPSYPISVCGLPPSTPPRDKHAWRWGGTAWHEVAVGPQSA